jgi:proteasome lid subunit RPN8/RPN11
MGLHLQRVLPLAQSVLWHPTSPGAGPRRPPSGPYPVFFDQKAISAVHGHYEAAGRQGMIGFLVGDLFECPTSHTRYVVIDSTIRLNQAVYGDKTLVIVSRLWERIQEELRKTDGHLIGWYHSHPPLGIELAPGDVETHLQYFKRPWHLAMVLGAEHEGPVAGMFRPRPGETAASLPFYELIESDEAFTGGKKHSILPWINMLTDDTSVVYLEVGPQLQAPLPPVAAAGGGAGRTVEVVRAAKPSPASPPVASATPTPPPRPAVAPVSPAVPAAAAAAKPVAAPPAKPAPAQAQAPAASPPTASRPSAPPPVPPAPPAPPAPPPPPAPAPTGTVTRPALGGRTPGRRDTQMKPPANALSNLPLVAAGGYDVGELEARGADSKVMTPRHTEVPPVAPPPPLHRSTQGQKPFAPALAPRSADGHPGVVAAVLLLALAAGGGAGWYFFLRPVAPDQSAGQTSPPSTAPTTAAPAPAVTPLPPPPDTTWLAFDGAADSVVVHVKSYNTRSQNSATGALGCTTLSESLVSVEDSWTAYNVLKRKQPSLDTSRATRDAGLYASVDSVERHYDRSGCQRP